MPDCTCGGQRFWDSECRTSIFALVSNARHFHLCDGLVPCRERRREGRDDQMARSRSGGIDSGRAAFAKNDVPRRVVLSPLVNLFHVMES
jgi:hypothetical protein